MIKVLKFNVMIGTEVNTSVTLIEKYCRKQMKCIRYCYISVLSFTVSVVSVHHV